MRRPIDRRESRARWGIVEALEARVLLSATPVAWFRADSIAAANGAPNFWLPIYQFATFYVVGWDTSINPSCTGPGPGQNAPFPIKGKKNQQNSAIWGYWINYTTFGTPNGQPCPINSQQPVNCVPALTR